MVQKGYKIGDRNPQKRFPNNATVASSITPLTEVESKFAKKKCIAVGLVLLLMLIGIGLGLYFGLKKRDEKLGIIPGEPQPPFSPLQIFQEAAVVSDAVPCAKIGADMLKKNGSAVDAAIASLICMGVYAPQSMGLGGGFFMTIYDRENQSATIIDARETAPLAATEDMFVGNATSRNGGLSVAVPGEVRGYWMVHRQYGGKLPWKELWTPSIDLARNGFGLSMHSARALRNTKELILANPTLRELYVDPKTNETKKEGDFIQYFQLASTMEKIANSNAEELYTGELAELLVKDIRAEGGIITMEDLAAYQPKIRIPTTIKIKADGEELTMYSVPPPGSGPILSFILGILDGYNFTSDSLKNGQDLTSYQRIIEAFKYAFARRGDLGDESFVDDTKVVDKLLSRDVAEAIRNNISDHQTFTPDHYYQNEMFNDDHGTAHLSVLAPNGDAVSVTSTINYWFGAGFRSRSTGIILNNEMDDFSSPGSDNIYGVPPSKNNFIKPHKRPMSSMCPSVFVNSTGDVVLIVGAAGGTRITTSTALTIAKTLWFKQDIRTAIESGRIHHQLLPDEVEYEPGISEDILEGLKKIGHELKFRQAYGSIVNGIHRARDGTITTNYDYRKGGSADGF